MESTNSTNCSYFEVRDEFTPIAIIRAAVGTFSAVFCVLVICVIIFFKKYKHFTQRLILNLAITALIHSLSYPLARINYYTERPLFDPYCYFGALFNLYSSWIEVLSLSCLTLHVFLNAVLDIWPSHKIEYFYVALTYFAPALWTWIPVIEKTVANGDAWCDIRTINEDCTRHTFGAIARFVLWYIPLFIILIVLFIASLIAAYKIWRRSKHWAGPYAGSGEDSEHVQSLQREIKPLIGYPVLYLVLNLFSFFNRIDVAVNPGNSNIVLWYLHILTSPFRGAVIAVVYALDPETRKRLRTLRWAEVKKAAKGAMSKDDGVRDYNIEEMSQGDSVKVTNYEKRQ